ncbi:Amidohydrolase 1 domain containing protein [Aphelenchoides fujianensis]|nr:Amidohydrolase 1 domain containing protein [Aphelenchoides fujianensis]
MSDEKILIRGGVVVNDDAMVRADVLCENGKITAVEANIPPPADCRVIEAADRLVIPGGIDPHTHMQMPFMGQVASRRLRERHSSGVGRRAHSKRTPSGDRGPTRKVCCDYALSCALTSWDDERTPGEMLQLTQPEYGINSFKSERSLGVHAENGNVIAEKQKELLAVGVTGPEGHTQSRPEELEAEATNRACVLAEQANCPLYVVHVMSKGAAEVIAHHRQERETCSSGSRSPPAFACDGRVYYDEDWEKAAAFVFSPPLSRDPTTPEVLMDLLACGQLHLTGTDNCTFSCQQKRAGLADFTKIPNGVNGVEDRLSIIWEKGVRTGKLDPMRFVAITRGRVAVGADADLVVWNPNATRKISARTHHHKHDFNIFEGMVVHGVAEVTVSGGRVVWIDGRLDVRPGSGRFVPLAPYSPIVFASNAARAEQKKPRSVLRSADVYNNNTRLGDHPQLSFSMPALPEDLLLYAQSTIGTYAAAGCEYEEFLRRFRNDWGQDFDAGAKEAGFRNGMDALRADGRLQRLGRQDPHQSHPVDSPKRSRRRHFQQFREPNRNVDDELAVRKFVEYLQIKTEQPTPDYGE